MIEQFWLYHCGFLRGPRGAVEQGGGLGIVKVPFLAAVAYHSEHGPVLVDVPFGREGPANAGEVFGAFLRKFGHKFRDDWAVVPRLEQLGFRASEVNHILMTHLHWDHTGGMKDLAHATFHVQTSEWRHANALSSVDAMTSGYAPGDYRSLGSRVRFLDLTNETDIAGGFDVFGDGCVQAVPLPGHSPGHVGYRFRLSDGRRVFFVGDAVFTLAQITHGVDLGIFPRLAAYDLTVARETQAALQEYWELDGDLAGEVLASSHDFDLGVRCLSGPVPLHET